MSATVDNCEIAYFAVKRWNSREDGDVIQIAAEHENKDIENGIFHAWTRSSKPIAMANVPQISEAESQMFNLLFNSSEGGIPVDPLETALQNFINFLKLSPKPILLVINSANFDFLFLRQIILETNSADKLCGVISGFSETLPILKQKFETQINSSYFAIPIPVRDLLAQENGEQRHEARHNVQVIKQVAGRFISKLEYIANFISYEKALSSEIDTMKNEDEIPNEDDSFSMQLDSDPESNQHCSENGENVQLRKRARVDDKNDILE